MDDAHNRTARAVTGAAEHRASCVTTTTTPAKQKSTKFTTKSEEKLSHLHQQTHRDSPGSVLDAGIVLSASAPDFTPASASASKSQLQLDLELDTDTYISEMEAYLKEHMGSDSPPASTSSVRSTVAHAFQQPSPYDSAALVEALASGNDANDDFSDDHDHNDRDDHHSHSSDDHAGPGRDDHDVRFMQADY